MDNEIGSEIAIIGLAGRFPGASSISDYWSLLREGREALRTYTDADLRDAGVPYELRANPAFVPVHGAIDHVAAFDAEFFGLSPQDAAIMDPQHRLFLETVWTALEDAAIYPARSERAIGVFAGCGMNTYFQDHLSTHPDLIERLGYFHVRHTGNDKDFLSTRVSYAFNLTGPSVSIQTACSTSLVAVHSAAQSLLSGECDVAIAGGSTVEFKERFGYLYQEGGIHDPTGHCRAFDADSSGTVFGSGSGAVILKRYADAVADGDRIHAVIRGTAINNDGAQKVGYLAPSVDGQAAAAAEALTLSGLDPSTISYIECHGTGTPVGDPIELAALTQAYGATVGNGACTIGSVKTNIGHLDTAAGVASLIKTVLMLSNRHLVPSLHFKTPNPKLELGSRPFQVGTKTTPWLPASGVRRAAINSLGVGGTNAHVIVEEAPVEAPSRPVTVPVGAVGGGNTPIRKQHSFPLSARTPEALGRMTEQLGTWIAGADEVSLADVAHTLQNGRAEFSHRRVLVASDAESLVQACKEAPMAGPAAADRRSVGFLFPGGGAQYPGMARDLYDTEPVVRQTIDAGLKILEQQEGLNLRPFLFPEPGTETSLRFDMARPSIALPALCLVEIAMARLWQSWGVQPDGMIGHSAGEYAAAHIAGVFTLADALRLMSLRGRLFETLPEGGMLSIPMAAEDVEPRLPKGLSIATINAASMCVVSGEVEPIEAFEAELRAEDIDVKRVRIDVAAHSPMVDRILDDYRAFLESLTLRAPQLRFASNLSGTWITPDEATDPEYWVRHLRHTVRFADGVEMLLNLPRPFLLEMGPGHTLTTFADIHPDRPDDLVVSATMRHPTDDTADDVVCLSANGALWAAGGTVDWTAVQVEDGHPISVPTYPFARDEHWIEPGTATASSNRAARRENVDTFFALPSWAPQPLAARSSVDEEETWLVFADARRAPALIDRARQDGVRVITVERGRFFRARSDSHFTIDPIQPDHYRALMDALGETADSITRVIHFWNATVGAQPDAKALDSAGGGWRSLFFLLKGLGDASLSQPVDMDVVADSVHALAGDTEIQPLKSTLWGPVRVAPREMPNLACRVIDLPATGDVDAMLWREILGGKAGQTVAYRAGRRFVPTTEPAVLEGATSESGNDAETHTSAETAVSPLSADGVYLVTGGTGGIATEMVRHLAETVPATFVLVSRSGLPEGDSRKARRIRAGRDAITATGATAVVEAADVTDAAAMHDLVARITDTYGPIRGAFHAAGTLDDAPIALKSAADVSAVLAPKVDGTRVLLACLEGQPLDLLVLFSSVSSLLGLPGQVDYCAANAFLDAAAHEARLRGLPAVAIDWSAWREVGMAANLTGTARDGDEMRSVDDHLAALPEGTPVDHALLSVRETSHADANATTDTFFGVIDPAHWVVNEHRMPSGAAVFPGTGYVDLLVSAARSVWTDAAVEVRELMFSEPMYVPGPCTVRVTVRHQDDERADVTVSSRVGDTWRHHADGVIARVTTGSPHPQAPLFATHGAAQVSLRTRETGFPANHQESLLNLGAHWDVLDELQVEAASGDGVTAGAAASARLALRPENTADIADFGAHPALLDIATAFALSVLDGYEERGDFYVPLTYEGARFFAPLPEEVTSRMVCRDRTSRDLASFDITLWDRDGNCVAQIDTFTMKRVNPNQFTHPEAAAVPSAEPNGMASNGMALDMTQALTTEEGLAVLDRVLAHDCGPQVLVSTVDIAVLKEQIDTEYARPDPSSFDGESVELDVENAPRDPVETQIASIWAFMLGVPQVGIHDDFFDLGGHSLIAVRVFARVKKELGVDLPLSTILQAPTVAAYADIVRQVKRIAFAPGADASGVVSGAVSGAAAGAALASGDASTAGTTAADTGISGDGTASSAPSMSATMDFNPLVPIRRNGEGDVFFCVHGAGGGVLNFRDLAQHLGDRPFYGLQARGINGQYDPHTRIEDMAAEYVAAIRRVQTEGPYLLGGYSGGGVIAYEMAQQLMEQGADVPLLVFLDTFFPHLPDPREKNLSNRLQQRMNALREDGWSFVDNYVRTRIKVERDRAIRIGARIYDKLGRTLPIAFREHVMVQSFHDAVDSYEPAFYPGHIVMFGAEDKGEYEGRVDDDLGWSHATGIQVKVHKIPGNHDNLVLPPNTELLAGILVEEIEAALIAHA